MRKIFLFSYFFRLGQLLCTHGTNPALNKRDGYIASSTGAERRDSKTGPLIGYNVVNVGVANLPLAMRTDLANRQVYFVYEMKFLTLVM